jgi:hypothetical protein
MTRFVPRPHFSVSPARWKTPAMKGFLGCEPCFLVRDAVDRDLRRWVEVRQLLRGLAHRLVRDLLPHDSPDRRDAEHDAAALAVEEGAQSLHSAPQLGGRALEFEPRAFAGSDDRLEFGEFHGRGRAPCSTPAATAVSIGGESREMIVRTPVAREVTFGPTQLAGLAVTVEDDSGLLAKAGFQSGDVIVAIDGVAIDSMNRLQMVMFGTHGHESAAVEVRRGGRTVTIPIDPAKFGVRVDYGGSWDPVVR